MIDLRGCVFIVDGRTEIRSLRAKLQKEYNCAPDFRQHPSGGGGITVQATGYARAAHGVLVEVLGQRYRKIICVTDREDRAGEATAFASEVRRALINLIDSNPHYHHEELESKIAVHVPDKMFENWIVADVKGIRKRRDLVKSTARQQAFEGKNGKASLKTLMKVPYKKTTHAPLLFKCVCFQRAVVNSPSFSLFAQQLELFAQ